MKLTEIKEYFDKEETKLEYHYFLDEDNRKQGKYKGYITNGNLKFVCDFVDGKMEGRYELYFDNGQLSITETYVNDKSSGEYKCFYDDEASTLECVCNYVDGKLHGKYKKYFTNGKIKFKENYLNGEIDGIRKEYFNYVSNKTLHNTRTYLDGVLHGQAINFWEDGTVFSERIFEHGILINSKHYYKNGKLEYEETFEGIKLTSKNTYHKSGELESLYIYCAESKTHLAKLKQRLATDTIINEEE